ncbi:MAG TPA: adenylate/guanylate cyclase domain-containing protein [Spirochaetota bacterium]|nr:adenylate/guanylate cyclase domain-containing protein [Spirochaetota bacterium]
MSKPHLPPDLVEKLESQNIDQEKLVGQKKLTVMFVDLRGFSIILEKMNAKSVLKILDIYFRMIASIVNEYNGIVDKYIGDGLMAVWGLPQESTADVYKAICTAIEIRTGMFRLLPELVKIGVVPLETGIGIATGMAVAGFVGPPLRRDFTLIGQCINRADRLQSIASNNRVFTDENTKVEILPYSYLIKIPKTSHTTVLPDEEIYEMEGIYEFDMEHDSKRKHPRVKVAKVGGITQLSSQQRKAALIKSISEGGLGIEIHDLEDFTLGVGEEVVIDSKTFGLMSNQEARGLIVRKTELSGGGIFRIKTWDIGIKALNLSEAIKGKLHKMSLQKNSAVKYLNR